MGREKVLGVALPDHRRIKRVQVVIAGFRPEVRRSGFSRATGNVNSFFSEAREERENSNLKDCSAGRPNPQHEGLCLCYPFPLGWSWKTRTT